jgi:hypothetical protein
MTLPFVTFSLSDQRGLCRRCNLLREPFDHANCQGHFYACPLTITFLSLQEFGDAGAQTPMTGARKTGRGRRGRHIRFPSLRPSRSFDPTPQEAINLPFTFVF